MVCLSRRRVIPALQRLVCHAEEEDLRAFAEQMGIRTSLLSTVSVIPLTLCRRGW